ncbi:MAG: transcription-repair coupling factor [Desulfobulbaceae bacterium]|nr:transcription-repair coupling factor [Desulfobulbaceae bacterium]HIJ90513.1 transcription-repair coupling factor [Deltaproteobacteria bacterium]
MDNRLAALFIEGRSVNIIGLRGSAPAFHLGRTARLGQRPILCLAPSETAAQHLVQDLALFVDIPVLYFPGHEIPPYTPLSPDSRTVAERLAALFQIHSADKPFILVMSIEALLRRVLPRASLANLAELVMRGEDTDLEGLVASLTACGYDGAALVQSVGEFSLRGGILDIFPTGFEMPVRLDFCGDTVESIRKFDPISQRSVEELEEIILLPVSDVLYPADEQELRKLVDRFRAFAGDFSWDGERVRVMEDCLQNRLRFPGIEFLLPLFYETPSTVLDYLPDDTIVFFSSPPAIEESLALCRERIDANFAAATAACLPVLPPERIFLPEGEWLDRLTRFQRGRFYDFAHPDMEEGEILEIPCGNHVLLRQQLELQRKNQGMMPELARQLRVWLEAGDAVFLACRTRRHAEHMAELLRQYDLPVGIAEAPVLDAVSSKRQIILVDSPLAAGFDLPAAKLHWVSEGELFGDLRLGAGKKKVGQRNRPAVSFEELKVGDIVVHTAHGLGRYEGLVNIVLGGIANDFFQLVYRDEDKLYVPVDQLKVISKYQGLTDSEPKLDKLGGKVWQARREKVKEEVWKVAQDLLGLYARRAMVEGHAFSPPDELFHEMEESFPYDETTGQLKAINEVLDDLTAARPMDRLVCGDVGYGKTEVAIRAAFKVVADNFQVAILVPTTVLAEQHAATFRERLQGFPVRVESLTRFRSPGEQKQIVQEVREGRVDIVVGTHRLLSQDVVFKRLGLLIIDEEHRFGVSHKEKLKKLKSQVDVLTLTATPIPRTLQLSLLSIRDLSVISSPPEFRRPVKTFVARDDELVIKEAVVRELQRGGQVFLVHNRVHSIQEMAARVQKLVPEARLAVAHGQMPGKALEEIMVRFVKREIDVLVCTTIIESGLDIPNANTIVITRADRLGLAEIYQLRGRVGRGREQAYAYLLVPSLDGLSKDAQQRLRALMDYNELGGGFKLAMSDLQIRGGGNILGISQSGNIAAVGYDLYLELLQQTVLDLKRKGSVADHASEQIEPEINLKISAFLPERYIPATEQRYIAYRRLSNAEQVEELMDLKDEFADRYGRLPLEAINLFEVMALKTLLRRLWISKLEQGPANLVFSFHEKTPVTPEKIMLLLEKYKNKARFTPEGRLIVMVESGVLAEKTLESAQKILALLAEDDI